MKNKGRIALVLLGIGLLLYGMNMTRSQVRLGEMTAPLSNKNKELIHFDQFRGNVVLVNNWATWCPPCIAEMPTIQTLKDSLRAYPIVWVMVSFDKDREKPLAFMTKRNFDLDVYYPEAQYPFVSSVLPTTFILNKQGEVVEEFNGIMDFMNENFVGKLKRLYQE